MLHQATSQANSSDFFLLMFLTVSQSMRNIKDIKNTLSSIETSSKRNDEKFNKWNETMSVTLQELKNKIAKARHIADGVRTFSILFHRCATLKHFTLFFFFRFVYRWHQNP